MISKYLNIISLILCIIITILLLTGCNKKYLERFENSDIKKKANTLTPFQKQIVDEVKAGNIDNQTIAKYIQDKKFTKKDLEVILNHLALS